MCWENAFALILILLLQRFGWVGQIRVACRRFCVVVALISFVLVTLAMVLTALHGFHPFFGLPPMRAKPTKDGGHIAMDQQGGTTVLDQMSAHRSSPDEPLTHTTSQLAHARQERGTFFHTYLGECRRRTSSGRADAK